MPSTITYGTGVVAEGVIANAMVTVGGVTTRAEIAVAKIVSVYCAASKPTCDAAGLAASAYRYRGLYPANLGIGMRASGTVDLASPVAALGHRQQYLAELPAFGGAVGKLVIDPSAADIARFGHTLVQLASGGATTPRGVPIWDDTQVPYCLNRYCSRTILDTGGGRTNIDANATVFTSIGVPAGTTTVPSGTEVTVKIDETAAWSFTVGSPPVAGVDLITLHASTATGADNLGIAPFFVFDMFYDYAHGTIGLAPKP
jgi:hypothetical protein